MVVPRVSEGPWVEDIPSSIPARGEPILLNVCKEEI